MDRGLDSQGYNDVALCRAYLLLQLLPRVHTGAQVHRHVRCGLNKSLLLSSDHCCLIDRCLLLMVQCKSMGRGMNAMNSISKVATAQNKKRNKPSDSH